MPTPPRVSQWIAQNYPRPTIDQEWLCDCCDWISGEYNISPSTDFQLFIQRVEEQLLQSNLSDSTVAGTGIDPQLGQHRQKQMTGPTALLVEIRSITEIAHSAFSLLNTHQTRLDRADLGLAQGDNNEQQQQVEEDEGPVPRFPRGMLKFELSDGCTVFRAVEYRSIEELELGATPLGFKVRSQVSC
ncbi:hypothetical protein HYDPIDRAFT_85625 [Hydnomerulius pinastri MD-312]|nr:hypothetical protein HYDPIDRAFT_85625 [Hydnomerulius pinastri MD-312]